ncbi:MAG: response regulator [Nitrososphaeraceae archaeon]
MQVLIAEDDLDIATLYKKALEKRKHDVTITSNGEECLKKYLDTLHHMTFGVSLPTLSMPRMPATRMDPALSSTGSTGFRSLNKSAPYDVVILDYSMPSINGMEVAKEILAINSHQRIIFASAYVKETLEHSIKQLKQVVELIQKPFELSKLVDTIEDKEVYEDLRTLNIDVDLVKAANPTHEQIIDLLERLKRIQKHRTF